MTLSQCLLAFYLLLGCASSHNDEHFHVHEGGLDDWDDDDNPELDYEPDNVIQRDQFVHNVQ